MNKFAEKQKSAIPARGKGASKQTTMDILPPIERKHNGSIYEVYKKTKDMERDEWLQLRNEGIGGSDIAAILNMSRWKSRRLLWLEKTGQKEMDDIGNVDAVHFGNVLEDPVAREFARRTGLRVRRRFAMLRRKDKPFMTANVDRLIIGRHEGLECKTASEYKKGEWSEESIPTEYFLQCQWYMAVTGFKKWHIAALIGGNKFFIHTIDRDDDLVAIMEQEAEAFWINEVQGGEIPAWSGAEAEADFLFAEHSEPGDEMADLDADAYGGMIDELERLTAEIKALEKAKKAIENELKDAIGDNAGAVIGDKTITWKPVTTNRLDSKQLKEEAPEIYNRYVKASKSRRFAVK